jgi:hypothetical protein
MIQNPKLAKLPLLFVANKSDVAGAFTLEHLKQVFCSNSELISERKCHFISCSALKGFVQQRSPAISLFFIELNY